MKTRSRGWLVDTVVGGLVGGIGAAILVVNLIIFAGIERGYESSIGEVFRQNAVVGVVAVTVLAAGPLVGVLVARRLRHGRSQPAAE